MYCSSYIKELWGTSSFCDGFPSFIIKRRRVWMRHPFKWNYGSIKTLYKKLQLSDEAAGHHGFPCFKYNRSFYADTIFFINNKGWGFSLTALLAVWILSTGGAGQLDSGRLRGEGGGSDQRRRREEWPLQPQQHPDPQQSTLGKGGGVCLYGLPRQRGPASLVPKEPLWRLAAPR